MGFLKFVRGEVQDAYYGDKDDDGALDDNAPEDDAQDQPDDAGPQVSAQPARLDARNQKKVQTVHWAAQSKDSEAVRRYNGWVCG
jgi:hypothetical protein